MYSLPLLEIAIACAVVGALMLLAGIYLAAKMTYPPKETNAPNKARR